MTAEATRVITLTQTARSENVFSQGWESHSSAVPLVLQTFVVRRSATLQRKVISVRMEHNSSQAVRDFPVRESQYGEFRVPSTPWRCSLGGDLIVGYAEERKEKKKTTTFGSDSQL